MSKEEELIPNGGVVWQLCAQKPVASDTHLLRNNSTSKISLISQDSRESETSRHHPPRFVATRMIWGGCNPSNPLPPPRSAPDYHIIPSCRKCVHARSKSNKCAHFYNNCLDHGNWPYSCPAPWLNNICDPIMRWALTPAIPVPIHVSRCGWHPQKCNVNFPSLLFCLSVNNMVLFKLLIGLSQCWSLLLFLAQLMHYKIK